MSRNGGGDGHLPPHNLEAERAVLGSLLIDPNAIQLVVDDVQPRDFYARGHRLIYEAMLRLHDRNDRIDHVTVCDELARSENLDPAGGRAGVSDLTMSVASPFGVETYSRAVRRDAMLRGLVTVATTIGREALAAGADPADVVDEAERLVFEVGRQVKDPGFVPVAEVLREYEPSLMQRVEGPGGLTGIATGVAELDGVLGGLQAGTLVVVGARPGVGKTALAVAIAHHAARHGTTAGIYSLEISDNDIMQRLVSRAASVPGTRLRDGQMDERELQRAVRAMGALADLPIMIDDTPVLSMRQLRRRARQQSLADHGLGLLIVDYLQLLDVPGGPENRVQAIADVSRGLKSLARELEIPVLACAQLSRAVEGRQDPVPRLSDLRDSGAIEQDADVVIFLHEDGDGGDAIGKHVDIVLRVAKHRTGPIATIPLRFRPSTGHFVQR